MPFDTKTMAKAVIAEAAPDPKDDWQLREGIRKVSVRLDLPLRDSGETLHLLHYLISELPGVCLRIQHETDEHRRLLQAQWELRLLGIRVSRKRTRRK